ncbi:MAG: DUF2332 domain-containing protein [Ilumatobacter sp.]|uniref:DUF2332 domain-containing protein n=1 Tax=Ilumatobacter sp. TaxID=1967498 RepID=UPI0026029F1B|nr:DUF2332 domain-containing protein [Ilumatobacter sp.]MDJ0769670.1 DUF2332 domain-containing protein [Ilumatobacter sp.]
MSVDTRTWYRHFASREAAGSSPTCERLAMAIADDDHLIGLLERLPDQKRQPNLLFAACRHLGAPVGETEAALEFLRARWGDVELVVRDRSTQTNEPARTATFLPALAGLHQPIALVEIGASAGLCLYPDAYRIRYDDAPVGPPASPVTIDVTTTGNVPNPGPVDVVWRAGIDLNPLDVRDPDDLAWLEACIWPEHDDRVDRLRAAASVVAADPPQLVRGDLLDRLDDVLAAAPPDATVVVIHSAVLNYVDAARRRAVAARLASDDLVWLSNEAPGVVTELRAPVDAPEAGAHFVLGRNGATTLAVSHPHGRWLWWAERR